MESRTRCPSEGWDDYCSQVDEDPRVEIVGEWIASDIESITQTIGGKESRVRRAFFYPDGFPEDPHEVGVGVSDWLARHPALLEVAYLLAKGAK